MVGVVWVCSVLLVLALLLCMVGLFRVIGWWAFGFGPVLVDTLFSFLRRFLEKAKNLEVERQKKVETTRKQKGKKIVEN